MRLHKWSFCYVAPTTSLTRLPVYTGCACTSWSASSLRSLCWHMKFFIEIAPQYLGPLVHVSDLPSQRCLHSDSTNRLVLPSFKLSTIGSRTFKVAHHINHVVSIGYYDLRHLRQLYRHFTQNAMKQLVCSLILIRIYYCNSTQVVEW